MVQGRRKRPLNALVITRERIQEVLDDAVERGRMTRDDASDLFGELVRRGTGGIAAGARKVTGIAPAFPIADYEDLTAAQVAERLDALSVAQLRQVRDHERRNANRKTVLAAIERKLP
jgi:polyhydroxyalkanoate synthesis regulator phasin